MAKDLPKRLATCLGRERWPEEDGLSPEPLQWEGPGLGDLMLAGKAWIVWEDKWRWGERPPSRVLDRIPRAVCVKCLEHHLVYAAGAV